MVPQLEHMGVRCLVIGLAIDFKQALGGPRSGAASRPRVAGRQPPSGPRRGRELLLPGVNYVAAPQAALLETAQALACLDDWAGTPGLVEIYMGVNDLHISLSLRFMSEPLALGMVDQVAIAARREGLGFGFGGVGSAQSAASRGGSRPDRRRSRANRSRTMSSS